jgi:thiol-disulfide isomerase/thioredoxin
LSKLPRLIAATLIAGAVAAPAAAQHGAKDAPPELTLHTLAGDGVSLSEFRGEVVVVNFWATWCIPCREELPLLESLSHAYAQDGVRFVAVSTDEPSTRHLVPAAIEEAGVTFDNWVGATTRDMKRLGLGTELPATAVLSRDGAIVARLFGVVTENGLREQIERATRAEPGRPLVIAEVRADKDSCCDGEQECDHHGDAAAAGAHGDAHDHDCEDAHGHEDAAVAEDNASLVPS